MMILSRKIDIMSAVYFVMILSRKIGVLFTAYFVLSYVTIGYCCQDGLPRCLISSKNVKYFRPQYGVFAARNS